MKKYTFLILLIITTTFSLAQKKEKIKGSKTVTIVPKEIGNFESIEINDNVEVYLEKGEKCELKMEADENLHDIIKIDLKEKTLQISTLKTATLYKKLIVRITYTNDLKRVTSKEKSKIYAIEGIVLDAIVFKSFDESELFLNANTKNFILESNQESKVELNLKSEIASLQLSKNAKLKTLITATDLKCDLYQKATATLEGDVVNASIRVDNNSNYSGNNLTITNAQLLAEGYSKCSINGNATIRIEAVENATIELYGDPKIEIKRFADNAVLSKKPLK